MKKTLLVSAGMLASVLSMAQTANHVVISEVYGGGGNTGATYKNDFIELYNPTNVAVSLAGWSVQYGSSGGSTWQVTNLTGSIPAHGFFLIQEAPGSGGTTNLPTPNVTGNIAMAATAAKVALVNTITALSGACPTGGAIVDFIGYGAANCSETATAPVLSNSTSAERKANSSSTAASLALGGADEVQGNGYDSDNNSTDFVAQTAITPQNSSSLTEAPGQISLTAIASAGTAPAEPATNGNFTISLTAAAPAGGVTVTYTLTGTATNGADYTNPQAGTVTIAEGETSATVDINIINDALIDPSETIILTLTSATNGYAASPATATLNVGEDDYPVTLIHDIQGSGFTAASGTFRVQGVVTAVYATLSPAGFYMQEEDADADGNPATSEGIFVVTNTAYNVGDQVDVLGTSLESTASPSFRQAVLNNTTITVIGTQPQPTPVTVNLPLATYNDYERYEGMLVTFPDELTVTENFNLGRFGELNLSKGGLVYTPTQLIDVNDANASGTTSTGASNLAAIQALASADSARTIKLDDGRGIIPTLPFVDANNTNRIGSTTSNITGILGYAFNLYRIQPIPSAPITFNYAARPAVPQYNAASNVKTASFNVLNYFNGDGLGGGFPTPRGANSPAEFTRQRDKIISAISEMNADVLGLIEMENDGTGTSSAVQDLVNGLNAVMGANTYSVINDGATIQPNNTDAIRCAIIYKSSVVTPDGGVQIGNNAIFNRPPVSQNFIVNSNGGEFNFIINHFKSKSCTDASGLNQDQGDGQSCYNQNRKLQANALTDFVNNTVIPTSGTNKVLSVGDYNAYYQEDPMDILRANGFQVLSEDSAYSYQFNGQVGSLDHAIATPSLAAMVTSIDKWHINSAEPGFQDYNDTIDNGGDDFVNVWGNLYTPTPWRSSDHDPVMIGLNVGKAPTFVGNNTIDTVCAAGNVLINNQLLVNDADNSNTLTFFVAQPAAHGTANGFPKTANSNGGTVTPTGLSYTANAGYAGLDSFVVGVTDGADTANKMVYIIVKPQPVANITPSGPVDICPGTTIQLVADSAAGYTFQWYKNGTFVSAAGRYKAAANANYGLVVTLNGCTAGAPLVTVSTTPTADLTVTPYGPTTFCAGDAVVLAAVSNPGYTYQWYKSSTLLAGEINSTYTATASGNYRVLISNKGCAGKYSLYTKVTVNTYPSAKITKGTTTPSSSLLKGNGGTGLTYQWSLNGSEIPAATDKDYTATQSGTYTLAVTRNGCTIVSNPFVLTLTGGARMTTMNEEVTIAVYPNPSEGIFNIASEEPVNALVKDVQGRVIADVRAAIQIDLSNVAAGVYMLQISDANGNLLKVERLVKK